jgi:hypothetical protein
MNQSDRAQFVKTLGLTMKACPSGTTLDSDIIELWWLAMSDYPLTAFRAACLAHLKAERFAPTIADITKRIDPPAPEPEAIVALARSRATPMGALAYTFLRDYLDAPWPTLKIRTLQFAQRWDEHKARLQSGPLTRHERHYLAIYCQGHDVPALSGPAADSGQRRLADARTG